MGNCIRKESAMQWAGEDWGSSAPETIFAGDETGKETLLGSSSSSSSSSYSMSSAISATEVKIKITKKQLEELLGKVNMPGMSVQQVLAQLMNAGDRYQTHQRSWRPALRSIPEVN